MNPAIFREYDIRGIAEKDFNADFVVTLGQAYGTYARAQGKQRVAIGRDCRLTSDSYAAALRQGLRSTGVDVVDIGIVPTPLGVDELKTIALIDTRSEAPGSAWGSSCPLILT